MSRAAFRQKDVERLISAAQKKGAGLSVDLRTLVVTVIPNIHSSLPVDRDSSGGGILPPGNLAPDGKENWDED